MGKLTRHTRTQNRRINLHKTPRINRRRILQPLLRRAPEHIHRVQPHAARDGTDTPDGEDAHEPPFPPRRHLQVQQRADGQRQDDEVGEDREAVGAVEEGDDVDAVALALVMSGIQEFIQGNALHARDDNGGDEMQDQNRHGPDRRAVEQVIPPQPAGNPKVHEANTHLDQKNGQVIENLHRVRRFHGLVLPTQGNIVASEPDAPAQSDARADGEPNAGDVGGVNRPVVFALGPAAEDGGVEDAEGDGDGADGGEDCGDDVGEPISRDRCLPAVGGEEGRGARHRWRS